MHTVLQERTPSRTDDAPRTSGRVESLPAARVARLVRRAAAGDAAAWEDLVDTFGGLVWAITRAYRLSDADAADVFQATWVRLLAHIGRLSDPTRLPGWLATTARREALRVTRLNARTLPTGDEQVFVATDGADVSASLLTAERDSALRHAFATLGSRDQTLLALLVADPRPSYEEISEALDMPIGSIGPTRARSLERLRQAALCAGLEEPA